MKKALVVLWFFGMNIAFSIAQDNIILWQADSVKINGLADEWLNNMRYYDNETQFHYGITNDENNLYLCFFTANQMMQMKILRTGVKIELKTKTKPKRTASIFYPKKDTSSFQMRSRPNPENQTTEERPQTQQQSGQGRNFLKRFLENNQTFTSEGFVSLNGAFPIINENGISLAINWDEKRRMAYEIVIPIKELFGEGYSLKDISKQEIKLKVSIDAMEMSSSGQRPAGGQQGGNMHQAGQQGQTPGGPSPEDRALLFVDQTLVYNFLLNKK